jgi:large subunit ribosomal protein L28
MTFFGETEYITEKMACQDRSRGYNALPMRTCAVCEKKPIVGRSISRRGLSKKSGGIGKKITGISRRRFFPNLQKVKVRFLNGTVKRIQVCASCLQAGKVTKAVSYKKPAVAA